MSNQPRTIKGKVTSASVVQRVDLTPEHFKLWLQPADPFPFQPGQYCTLGVDGIERAYSIVSSPHEPLLEVFVERIPPPDGHLTPLLHALEIGDTVTLRPRAKGVFLLQPGFRNHLMVATVTGIAPFVSMLRHWFYEPRGTAHFYVLQGASYIDEFGYEPELTALAHQRPNMRLVATCSRPQDPRNAGWTGVTGRVHTLVESYVREWQLEPTQTVLYACGHPQMIASLRSTCAAMGMHFEEEKYWKEDRIDAASKATGGVTPSRSAEASPSTSGGGGALSKL